MCIGQPRFRPSRLSTLRRQRSCCSILRIGLFHRVAGAQARLTPAQLHLGAPLGLYDELDLRQSAHPAAGHEHPVTGTQNPPRALVTEPWPISVPTAASPYVIAAPRAPTPIAGAPDIAATRTRPALDTKGRRRTAGSAERLRSSRVPRDGFSRCPTRFPPARQPCHSNLAERHTESRSAAIHNRPPDCYIMAVSGMSKNGCFPSVFAKVGEGFEPSVPRLR
jgi:hypothetical protein